jgi:hypothetical protein
LDDEDARQALVKIGTASVEPLIKFMGDPGRDIFRRILAARTLGEIDDPSGMRSLTEGLRDANSRMRAGAALALGELTNAIATEPLIACLNDPDADVRSGAVESLGKLANPAAVTALISGLSDSNDVVRSDIEHALDRLGGKFTPPPDFARKAIGQVAACEKIGEVPVTLRTKVTLVWDLAANREHNAQRLLDRSMQRRVGDLPVTVFLVSETRKEKMGAYSISGESAFRESEDIYVVHFNSSSDQGTPVGVHRIVSLEPRSERPVEHSPEYGDPAPPIADWIRGIRSFGSNH